MALLPISDRTKAFAGFMGSAMSGILSTLNYQAIINNPSVQEEIGMVSEQLAHSMLIHYEHWLTEEIQKGTHEFGT